MSLHLFVDSDIRKVLSDIDKVDQRCKDVTRSPVKIKLEVDGLNGLDAGFRNLERALNAVVGDLSRISGGINRIGGGAGQINRIGGAANGAGLALRQMTRSALGFTAALTGINLVRDAIGFLRESTVDFSSLLQNTMVGFETILHGNTKAAHELMDELKAFAIPTPFELPDLAPLAQQVIAFNLVQKDAVDLGQQVTGVLRDAGDAAFGLGRGQAGVDRLILSLGQMQSSTRITGHTMLEMSALGVNAWNYLAEATGKSTREVRELVHKGLILAKEGILAIRAGIEKDFGGAMEKASKTWTGAVASIKDIARQKLSNLFAPAFESLNDLAVNTSKVLQSKEFDRWLDEFTGKIETAFAFATGVYDAFVDAVRTGNPIVLALLALLGARFIWLANAMIGKAMYQAGLSIGRFIGSMPPQFLIALAVVTAFALAYKSNFLGIKDITDSVVKFVIDGVKSLSWGLAKAVEWATEHIPGLKALLGDQTGLADGVMSDFENFDKTAAKWKQSLSDSFNIDNIGKQLKGAFRGSLMPDINKALAESAAKMPKMGTKITMPHIEIADDPDGKNAKTARAKAEREALKVLKDQLGDTAEAWKEYAKAVEKSAENQIKKVEDLKRDLTDFFGFVQEKFVALGVINDPLGPLIRQFEKLLDLSGRVKGIALSGQGMINVANGEIGRLKSAQEIAEGKDGVVNVKGAGLVGGSGAGNSKHGDAAASVIDAFANGISTPPGMASCGNFAGQLLDKLGTLLPHDKDGKIARSLNVAKNFGDFAASHGTEVPVSQAQAGDVIIYHGKRYGALKFAGGGYHVAVAQGGGQLWESSGNGPGNQRKSNIYDAAHAKVYRLNGGSSALSPANLSTPSSSDIAAQGKKLGKLFDTDPAAMDGSKLQEILKDGFDGSVSKIKAVSTAWGSAVKDVEGSSVRFGLQTRLASKDFQDDLEFMAKITGRKVPEIIAWLRKFANAADLKLNLEAQKAKVKALLEEATKARWAIGDEAASGSRAAHERASILAFEGKLIQSGTLDERERSDALEIEIARRQRINDLLGKGADLAKATHIAQNEANAETKNRKTAHTTERNAEELNAATAPISFSDVKTTGLRETVDGVLPGLREALDNATISGDELAKILGAVPLPLLDLERNAKSAASGLDALPPRYRELVKLLDQLRARQGTATAKDRLSPFLADAQGAATETQNAFIGYGEKDLTPVQLLQNKAATALQNLEALKDAFAGDDAALAEIEKQSQQTASYYGAAITSAKQLQSVQSSDKVGDFLDGLKDDGALGNIFDSTEAELTRLRQKLKKDKWTDAEIEQVIPAQKVALKATWMRDRVHDLAGGVHDALLSSVEGFKDKGLGVIGEFANGVLNQLNHLAAQIITNTLWSKASGLFTSLLGGLAGGITGIGGPIKGVAGGATGMMSFADASAFVNGSHRDGLGFVPFDGYRAELHAGERVLTAQENLAYAARGAASGAALSRSPSGGASGSASGVVINNVYHVEKVVANDAKKFTDSLPGSPMNDVSEAQASRKIAQVAQRGAKHL